MRLLSDYGFPFLSKNLWPSTGTRAPSCFSARNPAAKLESQYPAGVSFMLHSNSGNFARQHGGRQNWDGCREGLLRCFALGSSVQFGVHTCFSRSEYCGCLLAAQAGSYLCPLWLPLLSSHRQTKALHQENNTSISLLHSWSATLSRPLAGAGALGQFAAWHLARH